LKKKPPQAGVTGPLLPGVLSELVNLLCRDDWQRWSTEVGDRYYYVVGAEAWSSEVTEGAAFTEVPVPSKQLIGPGPVAESHHRGTLLAKQPNYLERTRRRLLELGVDGDFVDRLVDGEAPVVAPFSRPIAANDWLEALTHFAQALRLHKAQGRLEVPTDVDKEDIEEGRQKLFLKEICEKYQRLVERAEPLESFSFHDERLEEASRCYLYGFHKAAIVLAASAVEAHLKTVTGQERFKYYEDLIKGAEWSGVLDKVDAEAAETIFKKRNDVVHRSWKPTPKDAGEVLYLARKLVDVLLRPA
jgi:hypothetical protein